MCNYNKALEEIENVKALLADTENLKAALEEWENLIREAQGYKALSADMASHIEKFREQENTIRLLEKKIEEYHKRNEYINKLVFSNLVDIGIFRSVTTGVTGPIPDKRYGADEDYEGNAITWHKAEEGMPGKPGWYLGFRAVKEDGITYRSGLELLEYKGDDMGLIKHIDAHTRQSYSETNRNLRGLFWAEFNLPSADMVPDISKTPEEKAEAEKLAKIQRMLDFEDGLSEDAYAEMFY